MTSLANLVEDPDLQQSVATFIAASQAVHRRPVNLRKYEVTHSEAVLRGARLNALLSPEISEEASINAYSLLAPDYQDVQIRTLTRAPMQVLARLDTLSGGPGMPVANPQELQQLGKLLQPQILDAHPVLVPLWVHNQLITQVFFAQRSATIARIVLRMGLIASGADPRGLGVPETAMLRNKQAYEQATQHSDVDGMLQLLDFLRAGMQEAEGIAAAA